MGSGAREQVEHREREGMSEQGGHGREVGAGTGARPIGEPRGVEGVFEIEARAGGEAPEATALPARRLSRHDRRPDDRVEAVEVGADRGERGPLGEACDALQRVQIVARQRGDDQVPARVGKGEGAILVDRQRPRGDDTAWRGLCQRRAERLRAPSPEVLFAEEAGIRPIVGGDLPVVEDVERAEPRRGEVGGCDGSPWLDAAEEDTRVREP